MTQQLLVKTYILRIAVAAFSLWVSLTGNVPAPMGVHLLIANAVFLLVRYVCIKYL